MRSWLDTHVLPAFAGRVLPIDIEVARRCALLHVPDPRAERDALIAATALVHGMAVVTRNANDFAATGVRVINPWKPQRAQISAIGINLFRSPRQTDREIGSDASVAASLRAPFLRSIAQAVVSYPSSPACTAHPARNPASVR